MRNKLAIVTSHPIQYQAPLFRALAKEPDIDLTVFFGSDHGVNKFKVDPAFGRAFAWDISLLEGYRHVFLENSRKEISVNDWRLDGPALVSLFAKEPHYDAVSVFGWNKMLFWQAIWWGRRNGIPLILRGESNLKHAQSWYVKGAKKIVFPLLFRQFKAFLAIGKLNAELYRHFGVPDEKIFSAPYCVDNNFFADRVAAAKGDATLLRNELGVGENTTVFLFMAKLIGRKRPLDLIRAHSMLGRADIHTIIVGDGPLFDECAALVQKSGLNNSVHLVGFKNQTELPRYYAAADVLVLPSEYETWGLVVNEAMASGLPCIVSDSCGCAGDMIVYGETGYTYPCGHITSLMKAMESLCGNHEKLRLMGESARAMSTKFDINRTVTAVKEALRGLHAT